MKLKHTILLFLFLFSSVIGSLAQSKTGIEEIKKMVDAINNRLEKKTPPDGFFLVIQDKDVDQIRAFTIYYFTYKKKDKKLKYHLNVNNESDSGHYFASVLENGKILKIVYSIADAKFIYLVKNIDNVLQVSDENGKLVFLSGSNKTKTTISANAPAEKALTVADVMPKPAFDLGAYLGENLHYPEHAINHNKQGRVLVKFVVNEDGSISDIELVKGFEDECNAEALRVVKNMPNWIPGKLEGKNVKVFFTLPIRFKLTK